MKNSLIILPLIQPLKDPANFQEETAKELAKENLVLLYAHTQVQKLTKRKTQPIWENLDKNIYLVRPLHLLPFERYDSIYKLNRILWLFFLQFFGKILLGKEATIFWLFHPSLVWMIKARQYFKLFSPIFLYDCVDFFAVDYFSTEKNTAFSEYAKNEQEMVVSADLVVANSHALRKHCRQYRTDIHLVPQGFRLSTFSQSKKAPINLKKLANGKPIIGYIGGINHRLDYFLLSKLVKNNPQWFFVFWGPVQRESVEKFNKILGMKNVIAGSSEKNEVNSIINYFDIATIPYNTGVLFNRFSYPMKLFEYFYMKKPVLSTPIIELKRFSKYVKIGKTTKEWSQHIDQLLVRHWPASYKRGQRQLAIANSWKKKVALICKEIENYEQASR